MNWVKLLVCRDDDDDDDDYDDDDYDDDDDVVYLLSSAHLVFSFLLNTSWCFRSV